MARFLHSLLAAALLIAGAMAHAQESVPWSVVPERDSTPSPVLASDRDAVGLPGQRPRLTMTLPLERQSETGARDGQRSTFSWSLETWQLNTASLAHIQCHSGRFTMDTYLAQDCQFVDQPLPEDSINLVQMRGDWLATPGLSLGVGAFRSQKDSSTVIPAGQTQGIDFRQGERRAPLVAAPETAEGLDVNVSFGVHSERVGEILVGLQLARYRQRMSLSDLGLSVDHWSGSQLDSSSQYGNSAQLLLGWRRGSFSGEMLGQHREVPLWLGGEQSSLPLNSFDLEFSWHALRNASLSVGVSNVLDSAPGGEEAAAVNEPRLEDPMESVYGRIPYVRYKHDL